MYEHVIVNSKSPDQMSQRFLNNGKSTFVIVRGCSGTLGIVAVYFWRGIQGRFRGFTEPLAGSWYNQVKVETLEEKQ
jgi:hypothetical protein